MLRGSIAGVSAVASSSASYWIEPGFPRKVADGEAANQKNAAYFIATDREFARMLLLLLPDGTEVQESDEGFDEDCL